MNYIKFILGTIDKFFKHKLCISDDCDDINREVNCNYCIKQYFRNEVLKGDNGNNKINSRVVIVMTEEELDSIEILTNTDISTIELAENVDLITYSYAVKTVLNLIEKLRIKNGKVFVRGMKTEYKVWRTKIRSKIKELKEKATISQGEELLIIDAKTDMLEELLEE